MKEHQHIVAYHEYDDGGGRPYKASDIHPHWDYGEDLRYKFCPECGAALHGFWTEIEASREEYRRQERAETAQNAAYREKPPT